MGATVAAEIISEKGFVCMKKFSIRNSHAGKALGAKGVYITLAACLLALGGAGIAAYNKAMEDITDNLTISSVDSTAPKQADNKKTDVKKDESSKPDVDIQTQPNVMPVNGEILEPFSNGELVKSETLGYWKTHDGVDIKADLGEPVKAMNKGTVTKIWDDPLWGKEMSVKEGDEVNAGEVIGAVGDTAQAEVAELSHLHFGLKKNGQWIDPIEFIDPADK